MNRWPRALLTVSLPLLVAIGAPLSAPARPPNVVVFIADDLGWGDLSSHGNTNLATPHLDHLARGGARFDRFYVQPVCAPTRAEFLTGRYATRGGVVGVSAGRERLDPDLPTIADAFARAGYATAAMGKWHNGTQAPYHPLCRGFDEFYGFTSGHWGHYDNFWLDHNGRFVKSQGYLADDFTNRLIAFAEANGDQPFFAVLAFNTPHSPMQVPDEWWRRHERRTPRLRGTLPKREDLLHTQAALAMCENLDDNVGVVLQRLEDLGVAKETIVVFFSDNGPNGHRWNDHMKGVKGSTDEGGVRSPLFVRWPKQIPPGVVLGEPAAAIDLLPTLAALAGVRLDGFEELDGVDLSASLRDPTTPPRPERTLFTTWNGRTAARRGRYLLDADSDLYDLAADPGQQTPVNDDNAPIRSRLVQQRDAWVAATPLPERRRPFDVGHKSMAVTHLPARDAQAIGEAMRSNRYPNCSYVNGWCSPDDGVAWDVLVHEPGEYAATVYVGYPADTPDTRFTLRCGAVVGTFVVPAGKAQPGLGAPHDRSPRRESEVRDFRPIDAGRVSLSVGAQTIELRPAEPLGDATPDFWLLSLERLD